MQQHKNVMRDFLLEPNVRRCLVTKKKLQHRFQVFSVGLGFFSDCMEHVQPRPVLVETMTIWSRGQREPRLPSTWVDSLQPVRRWKERETSLFQNPERRPLVLRRPFRRTCFMSTEQFSLEFVTFIPNIRSVRRTHPSESWVHFNVHGRCLNTTSRSTSANHCQLSRNLSTGTATSRCSRRGSTSIPHTTSQVST